ncbi:hypothetical protein B0T26DRAFT_165355 [Lasiosphaeria miniovina]|uniref:Microsomal glutathione S-transferase 3 n=1 Tax=Lasiosphaeria miniovina TaxID=1954250 RepID=A0AA40B5Z6_9PEZI|nr:uncharacterized protein B0T26DRAFT_165355 [Lasiosphaeria miniovina]KAK0728248.1 hypothetical protein B0T26DRAFT_165355 [Lasiosphaeria miniovina]
MGFTFPDEYGYVLLAATSTFFVNVYHSTLTSKYRKASGVKYPAAYASNDVAEKDPKAFSFNCAQRAHANYTENLVPLLGALAIAGLRFPVAAATLGATWSVARVFYARGYATYGPAGRIKYSIASSLTGAVLLVTALASSILFVLEK